MRTVRERRSSRVQAVNPGGAWGQVVAATDDTVTVGVSAFDTGDQPWGPMPFITTTPDTPPDEGDRAFVHFDTRGQAAYATVWT
jgi:hypothetical protein